MVNQQKNNRDWSSAAARRLVDLAGGRCRVEEAITKIVGDLLCDIKCPPTDLDALAEKLDITHIQSEDLPFSGELRTERNGFRIVYSSHLPPLRRRFTIAHEMAHAIFEQTGARCPKVGKELEQLCDMIAAEILMPHEAFLQKLGPDISVKALLELARTFRTSLSATALRLTRFRRFCAFEADPQQVRWSYGFIRKGPLSRLDDELQRAVQAGANGDSGRRHLFITVQNAVRKYDVDYAPIGQSRVLLVMHAAR